MEKCFFLKYLVNIFSISPTFLQPIFSDGEEMYLQEIEDDKISFFSKVDIFFNNESTVYKANSVELDVGERALYAIQTPSRSIIIGNSDTILSYFREHISDFDLYPLFFNKIQKFQAEIGAETKYLPMHCDHSHSLESVENFKLLQEQPELFYSIDHRRPLCSELYNDLQFPNILPRDLGSIIIEVSNNIFFLRERLKKSEISRKEKKHIEHLYRLYVENTCSLSVQIAAINCIVRNRPNEYRKQLRCNHFGKRRKSISLHYMYCTNLWTKDQACDLLKRMSGGSHYDEIQRRETVKRWGLTISPPVNCETDNCSSDENVALWEDYLEAQEEFLFDGENTVFWLEIKKLSSSTYSIIAQDYNTREVHFWIRQEAISDEHLILFIHGLYEDVGGKVVLLFLQSDNSERLFSERFSEWLNQNEDKYALIEEPGRILVFQ